MSINGALQVGRSAIVASQAAIQVAGNNMANAATEGYARRSVHFLPTRGEQVGRNIYVGRGVDLSQVRREVDTALQARFRDATSNEHAALMDQRFLTAIESIQNELTDNDLSSLLSDFFNAFSEVANNPEDGAVRSLTIEQGQALAQQVQAMRNDLTQVRSEVDRALGNSIDEANRLLDRIASVNREVAQAESSGGQANALRDQRDTLINELSQLVDIDVVEQDNGSADVFIDSIPVVLAGDSRGIELRKESNAGNSGVTIRIADDGTLLNPQKGEIGGLMRQRAETIQPSIDDLDQFTSQLIFQVNRLHSQGQGRNGFTSAEGTYFVRDSAANLNSSDADLPFDVSNGSFVIHVTNTQTGTRESFQINVDGNADSLDDLVDRINNGVDVPNVTAGITSQGAMTLDAAGGYEFSFSDDSSGALAALGINTYFTGGDAKDIGVNQAIVDDRNLLAVGADHVGGSNGTALAIADLQDQRVEQLGDRSLREFWQNSVSSLAVRVNSANEEVETNKLVRENLNAQIQGVSGVSLDEESINLLQYQRQFQAAARFIPVIDQAMQTLLTIGA